MPETPSSDTEGNRGETWPCRGSADLLIVICAIVSAVRLCTIGRPLVAPMPQAGATAIPPIPGAPTARRRWRVDGTVHRSEGAVTSRGGSSARTERAEIDTVNLSTAATSAPRCLGQTAALAVTAVLLCIASPGVAGQMIDVADLSSAELASARSMGGLRTTSGFIPTSRDLVPLPGQGYQDGYRLWSTIVWSPVTQKLYLPPAAAVSLLVLDPLTNASDVTAFGHFPVSGSGHKCSSACHSPTTGKLYCAPGPIGMLTIDPATNTSHNDSYTFYDVVSVPRFIGMGITHSPTTGKLCE